jgi:hypothetical protein
VDVNGTSIQYSGLERVQIITLTGDDDVQVGDDVLTEVLVRKWR